MLWQGAFHEGGDVVRGEAHRTQPVRDPEPLHERGDLVGQDLAAVVFLAVSVGKLPSVWALLLLTLIPLRVLFHQILKQVGHGELLVLFGFLLALGGAEIFELVGLKGDLGALVLGVVFASHPKADELADGFEPQLIVEICSR